MSDAPGFDIREDESHEHTVAALPVIIRRPKRVNVELQGPLLYPVDAEPWQQPIWGSVVRLYYGAQARVDAAGPLPASTNRTPRRVESLLRQPDGGADGSWVAILEFVRACWRSGWFPPKAEAAL